MNVFLYPPSSKFEAILGPVIAAWNLQFEANCSVELIRKNLRRGDAATLVLIMSQEIGQGASLKLCNELVDPENANSSSVIVFGTDSTAEAIAANFASGADDYICVPCPSAVLEARIGVTARRLLRFERYLKETEAMSPPFSRPPESALRIGPTPAKTAASSSKEDFLLARVSGETLSQQFLSIPTLRKIKDITISGLHSLNIKGLIEVDQICFGASDVLFGAWSTLLLPNRNLWMDIVIETNQRTAEFLHKHVTPEQPGSAKDASTSLVQLAMILKGHVQNSFKETGEHVINPSFPQRVPSDRLNNLNRFVVDRVRVAVGSSQMQMCISYFVFERRPMYKTIEEISPQSISDEMIPLPGSEHPLLHRGVMLNTSKLKSLQRHFEKANRNFGMNVFEASGIASAINN